MKLSNTEKDRSFEEDVAYLRHKLLTGLEISEDWFEKYMPKQYEDTTESEDTEVVIKKQLKDDEIGETNAI